jgi:hypothetical protein
MSELIHVPAAPYSASPAAIMEAASLLFKGGMTNKNMNRPEHLAARIMAGMEVGLKPVQACRWIMIINGNAVIWGDAALALVRNSGQLDDLEERIEGDGDERTAICVSIRRGAKRPKETRFSMADARRAGLLEKAGPWQEHPDRMLTMRARSWNLRDEFGDVLCGLGIAEEEMDIPGTAPAARQVSSEPAASASQESATASTAIAGSRSARYESLIAIIAASRPSWLRAQGIDANDAAAVKAAWAAKLATLGDGITSVKQLPREQLQALADEICKVGHTQQLEEVFGPDFDKAGAIGTGG